MANGNIAPQNNGIDVSTLLNLFKPGGGSSTTVTDNVSDAKTKAILDSILSGTQGLAAVSGMQKGAGLYNSTTNGQLTNDLLARASAQTAALSSSKTTTTSPTAQLSLGSTLLSAGGAAAVNSLLGPSITAGLKKTGVKDLGDKLSSALFGDSAAAGTTASAATAAGGGLAAIGTVDAAAPVAVGGLSDILGGAFGTAAGDGALGGLASLGLDFGSIGAVDAAAPVAIAGIGDILGGSAIADGAAAAVGATEGGSLIGTLLTAAAAWIVCTELHKQGKMPTRYYKYGARVFANYKESDKAGYYIWAIPCVKHLRKHPDSLFSKFLAAVFNSRAQYIAAVGGCKEAKKTITGMLITKSTYILCCTLARTIVRKPIDWTVVYRNNGV
jgi:hypothetical protein